MNRAPGRTRRTLTLVIIAALTVAAIVGLIVFYPADWPGFAPPSPVTVQGQDTEDIYRFVFTIAAIIFLLVEGAILFAVLRYRRTDDELPVQTHGNLIAEAAWTIVPAIIVIALFFVSIGVQNKVEARSPNPDVTIDVVGFQWQWTVGYGCPASYATEATVQPAEDCEFALTGLGEEGPDIHVPVNQTVHFRLHAADVIHAFYVPHFLYKKDVIPGRVNGFDVIVEQPGTYGGQCAELCGLSHGDMFFTLTAEDRGAYDTWYATQVEGANASPSPGPSGSSGPPPAGSVIDVSASNAAAFDQSTLTAPAGTPITIHFMNKDPSVAHNVAIKAANVDGSDFIGLPLANPGETVDYVVPALAAGTFTYSCTVHPNMTGTLAVQ
ncbi:MAG: cytochrome c oxidase subunit II [Candidatus Limnocylindrales bacterium]